MNDKQRSIFERALAREKAARKRAEHILEQKSAELYSLTEQLRLSNEKLEELVQEKTSELKGVFENIIDVYVVMDLGGNILKRNEAADELFGLEKEEPANVVEFIYKADLEYAMASFQSLLENGYFTNYQARIFTRKKQVHWVQINASLIYDAHGKPIAAQGIVRDITEERKTNALIQDQQQKLSSIVDHSSLGIVLVEGAQIIQCNKAAQDMLEFTEDELLQRTVQSISVAEDYPESAQMMQQMNEGGLDNFVINKRYIKKDGSYVWAKTNVSAIRNEDGSIRYQLAMMEDITEALKNEAERKKLLESLEQSNKELEEYAHIVSHDLKSPLRNIYALVDWIKSDNEGKFDVTTEQNFTLIEQTLEKMESLISGILNYSSISAESFKGEKIDLNTMFIDVYQMLHIPEHIMVYCKNVLPVLMGDRTQLQQLFQNLIGNAINHIDKAEGRVEIDVVEKPQYFEFSIADNGVGIKKEYHQKIFGIFQSLSTEKKSTGIGLSIVKKIVEIHGGTIWLESEVGQGTTFYFTLSK